MTPSEFANNIRSKHPGAYDDMSDGDLTSAVLKKYPQYQDMVTSTPAQLPSDARQLDPKEAEASYWETTAAPNINVGAAIQGAMGLGKAAMALPSAIRNSPDLIAGLKGMLPNPSLKAMGGIPSGVSEEMAQAAKGYATAAQPELGQTIAKAGAQGAGKALAPLGEETGDIAALDPAAQSKIFSQPIVKGVSNTPKQMLELTTEHNKQIGEAIGNTLQGLEKTGTKFDPKPIIQKAESMLMKDAEGNLMTTGVQGETNGAIQDALSSLKDYAKGKPINWTEANKIKGMLQNSSSYAARRFDESNEAFKQVASLIKEGIDDQATNVLKQTGGNIEDFKNLRSAYGKTSVLKTMLEKASKKAALQPSTPEMVMQGIKHYLPWAGGAVAVGETLKHLF